MDDSIPIPSFPSPISAGTTYVKLSQSTRPPPVPESDLLKNIRQALSATTPIPYESPRRTVHTSSAEEEELVWQDRTVVWSIAGIQQRKWIFETETKDQVLWACWASFDNSKFSQKHRQVSPSLAWVQERLDQKSSNKRTDDNSAFTFGEHSHLRPTSFTNSTSADYKSSALASSASVAAKRISGDPSPQTTCICIFLTSFAMMYTKEGGLEYATNLPFHVRRVWGLPLGGVMIERVVTDDEPEDEFLPSLFSLSGPYEEVKVVGSAYAIDGGFTALPSDPKPGPDYHPHVIYKDGPRPKNPPSRPNSPDRGKRKEADTSTPPPTFGKYETIIFVSSEPIHTSNRIMVSHDPRSRKIRVWRYVRDLPDPLPKKKRPNAKKKPTTTNTTSSSSPQKDDTAQPTPSSSSSATPTAGSPAKPAGQPFLSRSKSAIPSTPTQDTIMKSLALAKHATFVESQSPRAARFAAGSGLHAISLTGGGSQPQITSRVTRSASQSHAAQPSGTVSQGHNRVESQSRNDLSMTMDRMVLGSGEDMRDYTLGGRLIDDRRMKPEFWMECLYELNGANVLSESRQSVTAALYDTRFCRSTLAILVPSSNTAHLLYLLIEGSQIICRPFHVVPAIALASLSSLRHVIKDLLIIRPNNNLALITVGGSEMNVRLHSTSQTSDTLDIDSIPLPGPGHEAGLDVFSASPGGAPFNPAFPSFTKKPKRPMKLMDPAKSTVTVVFDDGSEVRTDVDFSPPDWIVSACFNTLSRIIPLDPFFAIQKKYLQKYSALGRSGSKEEHFSCLSQAILEVAQLSEGGLHFAPNTSTLNRVSSLAFVPDAWSQLPSSLAHSRLVKDTALQHLQLPVQTSQPAPSPSFTTSEPMKNPKPSQWAAPIMYFLHILGENLKVCPGKEADLSLLAPLLIKLGRLTRIDYADYWARLYPNAPDAWAPVSAYDFEVDERIPQKPPDVLAWLQNCLQGGPRGAPFPDLQRSYAKSLFSMEPCGSFGEFYPCDLSRSIIRILDACTDISKYPSPQDRASNLVSGLMYMKVMVGNIDSLPFAVGMVVREAIRLCREYPRMTWLPQTYTMIERTDLAKMALGVGGSVGFGDAYRHKKDFDSKNERDTIGRIVSIAHQATEGKDLGDDEADFFSREFTDVRFGTDRRLQEVDRMLQSSIITSVKVLDRPDLNEHDLAKEQYQFALVTAERTLSLPIGRAMYTVGMLGSVDADEFNIPPIELDVKFVPQGATVAIDPSKLHPEAKTWADFHNGTAAALRVSRAAVGVDSTWIAYNRPSELNPRHAGFIFGLGLNGHLRGLYTWHTFSYLTPKHDVTTMAMLLGLSASHVGSKDLLVTKMLTVHTPALLPPAASELNVGLAPQMAALMGIGILYLGTRDRRMAEAALGEIAGRDFGKIDTSTEQREAYGITAALSFGMIMCGQGSQATSPADLEMVGKLRLLFSGQPSSADSKALLPAFDHSITSPAAAIALGLMFLKTERADVASLFDIPFTPHALSRVQPNIILVCALARHLILWNDIVPTVEWVSSQVPKSSADNEELQACDAAIRDSYDLAYYNLVAGVCFSIALKHAGTADQRAETTLIYYYDLFSKSVNQLAMSFDSQIKRSAARDSLNLISLCVGMVMAGTGELNALRRLRYAHGQLVPPFVRFGSHMTTHMALGLLFLGGGRYTLGTSNAAIACLVTAFYPRWPNMSSDWKGLLPALRHLWVLAIEPRCLIARDADSGETVYIPVKIKIQDGAETKVYQYTSPSLIPDFSKLKSIIVDSPRYWPYYVDLANGTTPKFAETLMRHQTIWVKRRSGYLGYGEDPRGNRSIFARVGFRVGDTSAMDFPTGAPDERATVAPDLQHFLTSFSVDSRTIGFADWLCCAKPESQMEAMALSYCQQTLLECLIHDKTGNLTPFMTFYLAKHSEHPSYHSRGGLALQGLASIKFVADFYAFHFMSSFGGKVNNVARAPLIRSTLLRAATYTMDKYVQELRENDPEFMQCLSGYFRGDGLQISVEDETSEEAVKRHRDMQKKLAFYLTNERVVHPESLIAIRKLVAGKVELQWSRVPSLPTSEGGSLSKDDVHEAIMLAAKAVLLNARGMLMAEMTNQAFDDMMSSGCFTLGQS